MQAAATNLLFYSICLSDLSWGYAHQRSQKATNNTKKTAEFMKQLIQLDVHFPSGAK